MLVERVVFQLKFGKAKEAIDIWNKIFDLYRQKIPTIKCRMLTDMTGPSYNLILEIYVRSFTEIMPMSALAMSGPEWKELYDQFKPLCESATRELYHLEKEFN